MHIKQLAEQLIADRRAVRETIYMGLAPLAKPSRNMWLKTSLHRAKRVNAKALDREALKYLEKLAYPDPDEWNPEEWLAYQREMYLVCRKAAKLLRAEQHRNENYYWANQPNNEEDSNRYEGYNPTDELPYSGN